jgi:hypothetical protein
VTLPSGALAALREQQARQERDWVVAGARREDWTSIFTGEGASAQPLGRPALSSQGG